MRREIFIFTVLCQLRAELDATYARLYGLTRDELCYTPLASSPKKSTAKTLRQAQGRFPRRNLPRAEGEGSPQKKSLHRTGYTFENEQRRYFGCTKDCTNWRLSLVREDFWTSTSNKQLNFAQHVKNILNMTGKASVVVPYNALFKGRAGEVVRRKLLHECDAHTLLRLPTGIFYAQGVKATVLFFDRKSASETPWTKQLWIYDLRTNIDFTLKTNPPARGDLDEFVECFHADNRFERAPT